MTQPTWTSVFEKYGIPTKSDAGHIGDDPFALMAHQARSVDPPYTPSSVTVTLSTASNDYSKQRLSVSITCSCPPTEAHIQLTTEAAFILARRMVNAGADAVGLPRLGE